jgi:hypothetical protein
VIVFDSDGADWERLPEIPLPERRIDVWWFEDESSRLALLLAHLMTRTEQWEDATIRVLAPATEEKAGRLAADLEKRIDDVRIDAESEVVVDPRLEDVVARSGDAALVLVPLRVEGMRLSDAFGFGIDELLPKLPIVALIAASQDVRLSESESESEAQPAHAPGGDTEVREGTDAVRPQGISARIEPR